MSARVPELGGPGQPGQGHGDRHYTGWIEYCIPTFPIVCQLGLKGENVVQEILVGGLEQLDLLLEVLVLGLEAADVVGRLHQLRRLAHLDGPALGQPRHQRRQLRESRSRVLEVLGVLRVLRLRGGDILWRQLPLARLPGCRGLVRGAGAVQAGGGGGLHDDGLLDGARAPERLLQLAHRAPDLGLLPLLEDVLAGAALQDASQLAAPGGGGGGPGVAADEVRRHRGRGLRVEAVPASGEAEAGRVLQPGPVHADQPSLDKVRVGERGPVLLQLQRTRALCG